MEYWLNTTKINNEKVDISAPAFYYNHQYIRNILKYIFQPLKHTFVEYWEYYTSSSILMLTLNLRAIQVWGKEWFDRSTQEGSPGSQRIHQCNIQPHSQVLTQSLIFSIKKKIGESWFVHFFRNAAIVTILVLQFKVWTPKYKE